MLKSPVSYNLTNEILKLLKKLIKTNKYLLITFYKQFRGFYKGFFAPFCVLPVNNAILFYTEDRFKQMGFDGLQTGLEF